MVLVIGLKMAKRGPIMISKSNNSVIVLKYWFKSGDVIIVIVDMEVKGCGFRYFGSAAAW